MKYASLVFKNLFRSGRRTTLTIFSIAVSLFIFSALVSLPTVANQLLADSGSSVRIACRSKMGLSYPLPEAYKNKIAATRHVVAVVPEKVFFGLYHDVTDQFPNIAVEPDQIELMWPDWGISPQSAEQFRKVRRGALVSPDTLKRFNLHLGQQIQLHGTLYPFNVTLTLVGTIDSAPVPYLLLFRRDYLEEAAGRPGTVDNFWVRVDSAQAVPQVIAALDEKFANSSAETQSESEGAFLAGILNNYRIFFRLAELLGVIVVLTIGLVAANTAAMSIRERRSEIAVMRAIGFPPRIIFSLLLSESLLIGLAGGIIGCGSGFIALKLFTVGAAAIGPLGTIRMPPSVLAETLVAAVLIGGLSALVPARSAAQRNIVDTLRMVD